ncbi:MAG: molybdenum cofactor guanylyltransferase [Deltaproteobacteria bacterium]|nr:molybdenum cofactor guanylyltransferase [Deltaproteobacteria bacterium]MBW2070196.1 molybdenum cofactor guanylyltransferase [Deltaproteobacteria bacterium]
MIGVVLAGGKSRRFGRNKALELFQGERLIERQVRTLGRIFSEVIIVSNTPEVYVDLQVTLLRDIIPEQGPLGGIYTGLLYARDRGIFVAGCDMPFLQAALIGKMVELAANYDVVIPEKEGRLEPLHAAYSSRCLPHIEGMLKRKELQVIRFFPAVRVYRLGEKECQAIDPLGISFFNINTVADLSRAEELLQLQQKATAGK